MYSDPLLVQLVRARLNRRKYKKRIEELEKKVKEQRKYIRSLIKTIEEAENNHEED